MKSKEQINYIIRIKSIFGMDYDLKKDEIKGKTFSVVKYEKNGTYNLISGYFSKNELNTFLLGVAFAKNKF